MEFGWTGLMVCRFIWNILNCEINSSKLGMAEPTGVKFP